MADIAQAARAENGKAKNVILWVLQVAAAGMFLMAGGSKLAGAAPMVALFNTLGMGQWFRYVTGLIEVVSAGLLLVPGLAALAAFLLFCTMVGAVLTHVVVLHSSPAIPAVLLLVTAVILWGRREQLARLVR